MVSRVAKKRADPSYRFLRDQLKSRHPKWGVLDDVNAIDMHPLQILEWQLLSLDKDQFNQFAQDVAPKMAEQAVFVTGDPVIDELERKLKAGEDIDGFGGLDGWE